MTKLPQENIKMESKRTNCTFGFCYQKANPKKPKEQFLSCDSRKMFINIENNISQKEIFTETILLLQGNNSYKMNRIKEV